MDRNYIIKITGTAPRRSLSARRAWIEILCCVVFCLGVKVALRKESVDRNSFGLSCIDTVSVALRKESVDRNDFPVVPAELTTLSLSARRAWIEIPAGCWRDARRASLSARRAWIEMPTLC